MPPAVRANCNGCPESSSAFDWADVHSVIRRQKILALLEQHGVMSAVDRSARCGPPR